MWRKGENTVIKMSNGGISGIYQPSMRNNFKVIFPTRNQQKMMHKEIKQ